MACSPASRSFCLRGGLSVGSVTTTTMPMPLLKVRIISVSSTQFFCSQANSSVCDCL
jgi:hypothetical protein